MITVVTLCVAGFPSFPTFAALQRASHFVSSLLVGPA
jgi:hypothetical protein